MVGLDRHLREFTEEERLYREYSEVKGNPAELRHFLKKLDPEYLSRHHFVLPELKDELDLHFSDESWVWANEMKDIFIHKHPRYMPAWNFFHSFYEIHYVYSGHSHIEFENKALDMTEGDLCVIAPEARHTVSVYDESIVMNVKVRKSTFKNAFPALLSGRNMLADFFISTMYLREYDEFMFFEDRGDERIKHLFAELYVEHYNKELYYRQMMNQILTTIFFRLLRTQGDASECGQVAKDHRMESIFDYIRENYADVTLSGLAQHFHFAEQYLSRYIRKHSGMTYTDILRTVKLEKALEMLDTTGMTIANISTSVGYSSPENFMRQFKNKYGLSPTSYRKHGIK